MKLNDDCHHDDDDDDDMMMILFSHFNQVYHCGSPAGWSSLYFFTAMQSGTNWSPKFVVYGDMGNTNARSLGALQEETQLGYYDLVLHVGKRWHTHPDCIK